MGTIERTFRLLIIAIYFLLGNCYIEESFHSEEVLLSVETKAGIVRGVQKRTIEDKLYLAFEGIPYAKPPVGDRRFAPPEKFGKWNGTLLGNKWYTCAQLLLVVHRYVKLGQEDCLYLNVYVPRERIYKNANFSVIDYIHPGTFKMLSPRMAAGEIFIMNKDVIYVNFNYRLGVFGFLSTDDEIVPGNMGLKDQTMALQWVKENIHFFGGNPDSITLIGSSAGGVSVHYHYLSPLSRGLFHRGMSQSGTALNSWALINNPREKLMNLTKRLNCSQQSSKVMIDCLRNLSRGNILEAVKEMHSVFHLCPFLLFGPVVEKGPDAFLPEHPYKLLSSGNFMQVPWIASNTVDEGVIVVQPIVTLRKLGVLEEKWDDVLPFLLNFIYTANNTDLRRISEKIRDYYLGDKPAPKALNELIKV
ncbi:venom carboxylesterase-6 isoform X2 [Agrilus planipennis]|uniref:Carboxylic ester hydrolase n=1 Tax=Agrilus planipennis TaxID=224129 RepID=A0A7F5R9Q7_AGRPL|nr:venom carboxylesterase-6 isoform X2 [Agrilus planipennis]